MNSRLFDPWLLLELNEMLCWIILGIVIFGIAAEFVGMLFLFFHEGAKTTKTQGHRDKNITQGRKDARTQRIFGSSGEISR